MDPVPPWSQELTQSDQDAYENAKRHLPGAQNKAEAFVIALDRVTAQTIVHNNQSLSIPVVGTMAMQAGAQRLIPASIYKQSGLLSSQFSQGLQFEQ